MCPPLLLLSAVQEIKHERNHKQGWTKGAKQRLNQVGGENDPVRLYFTPREEAIRICLSIFGVRGGDARRDGTSGGRD